jgi:diaminopimelate epimerase
MATLKFDKMHGCGNDFVVIDNRIQAIDLNHKFITTICDRRFGIGCDQLIIISESQDTNCQAHYQFYNPDASQAEQCGNGQRCIAWYLHRLNPEKFSFKVSGLAGVINSQILDHQNVRINIGGVSDITCHLINEQTVIDVQLANPHRVLQVENVSKCDLNQLKNTYSANVDVNLEIVEILNQHEINIRVHERGTGETLACGSGACAAVLAFQASNQLSEQVKVHLPGGDLVVEYQPNQNEIFLTGPAKHIFSGAYNYDK